MRVSDSYTSLVQGVSEQSPETRGPGRMGEQINVLPDPVHKLTRRHGTHYVAEQATTMDTAHMAGLVADSSRMRTLTVNTGLADIDLMYNPAGKGTHGLPPVIAFNRTAGAFMAYARNAVDPVLDTWETNGVSAITTLGKYVVTAANNNAVTADTTDMWDTVENKHRTVIWIRNGAFSRTFTIKVHTIDGSTFSVSHTTPTAAYMGTLDTSGVPAFVRETPAATSTDIELAFPERQDATPPWGGLSTYVWRTRLAYGKFDPAITGMTERLPGGTTTITNSYPAAPASNQYYHAPNSEFVYFHPTNLDLYNGDFDSIWYSITYTHAKVKANDNYTRIVNDMTAAYNTQVTQWLSSSTEGITPERIALDINSKLAMAGLTSGTVYGSHIQFSNVDWAEVDDGGDGSLIRVTDNTVQSVDDLTKSHFNGKVVRVQAQANAESYYLKAVTDNGDAFGNATWIESGRYQRTITSGLILLYPVGTVLYAASSAALLASMVAGDHPGMVTNQIGDDISNPNPHFVGRDVNYLGVFQDRLLVGSGGTISSSRTGDYFNFYRSTVVTVPANDAFSMRAEGPDDDTVRYSCIYNRDLILFGGRRQYLIPGRVAMTPLSANMPVLSSHPDANPVPPVDSGGLVFYTSVINARSTVSQMEPTLNIDSPSAFSVSTQLDDYLAGEVTELTPLAKPASVLVRTTGARDTVFVFQYLDTPQGRKQDAWFKIKFNPAIGTLIGVGHKGATTYLYFMREAAGILWLVCDRLILDGGLSSYPYLDSMRSMTDMLAASSVSGVAGDWRLAIGEGDGFLRGGVTSDGARLTPYGGAKYVGCLYDSFVTLTNPVILDSNSNVVTTGDLVVSFLNVTTDDSSGMDYTVDSLTTATYSLSGVAVGSVIGEVPVESRAYNLPVYQDTKRLEVTLRARKWYPLTISAIDWVGQYFNRTPRR